MSTTQQASTSSHFLLEAHWCQGCSGTQVSQCLSHSCQAEAHQQWEGGTNTLICSWKPTDLQRGLFSAMQDAYNSAIIQQAWDSVAQGSGPLRACPSTGDFNATNFNSLIWEQSSHLRGRLIGFTVTEKARLPHVGTRCEHGGWAGQPAHVASTVGSSNCRGLPITPWEPGGTCTQPTPHS